MIKIIHVVNQTPLKIYQDALDSGTIHPDARQKAIINHLQSLYDELLIPTKPLNPPIQSNTWFQRLFAKQAVVEEQPQAPVRGLYLWGGVGRGKTFLCDIFYEALPFKEKKRQHFHRFMQSVHEQLNGLGRVENTLDIVASNIAKETRVLVLDEMHINDITDAMIMGGLLKSLFYQGVTLVTTANIPPSGLYKDGLQRANFLPAIALMEQHTAVVNLDSDTDYRLRVLEQANTYHTPLSVAAEEALSESFFQLTGIKDQSKGTVDINAREIDVIRSTEGTVWFSFEALCSTHRSTSDYIEIARCFHTVLVSGIPVMDQDRSDEARRFLNLIDEFYDRNVKLIVSAEALPDDLYVGKRLAFEFQRCASRLREMQSHEFLQREHLA